MFRALKTLGFAVTAAEILPNDFRSNIPDGALAAHAYLVAVGVAEISAVIVRVVMGPQSRCAFRCAAILQGDGMGFVYAVAVRGQESNHMAITWRLLGGVEILYADMEV